MAEYDGKPYPGQILEADDSNVKVQAMHRIGRNRFFGPQMADYCWYE